MNLSLGVPSFAGYFKNLAATAYKIYQAELIIFAWFVYTSQTIFKHSEQTTYDIYIQHYLKNLKIGYHLRELTIFKVLTSYKESLKLFFQLFFFFFLWKREKHLITAKNLFWSAFGCAQHPGASWNTQHLKLIFLFFR